ncbi:hypothetical protein [Actinoplanes regularis]|uniref:Uncharacterized protein n=1 Tax=Actinoplanes regularis TaxID=52697 RepID=A0A239E7R2_9ACTN|nr:hypothetical protein [Actinoplanes regularis]GIE89267.1 hypothetical protein Are01nite_57470 [Actinoplanes regularis]SNS40667.1 hypothetical protein SAMN06264365_11545 [Actinoplanes regularis]
MTDGIAGAEPLVDGMNLSVRLRRDFTVTDAGRLLAAARRIHQELEPGASAEDAAEMVSCAADALFVVLEHAGLLGDAVDDRFTAYAGDGLAIGGWRAEVVTDEPWPLSPQPRGDCLRSDDVFALPAEASPPLEH